MNVSQRAVTSRRVDVHTPLPPQLDRLAHAAGRILSEGVGSGRLGVAYSGGVDSAVLAAVAGRALGSERCVLLLAVSASLARREHRLAHRQAEQLGMEIHDVATDEISNADYAANPVNRCYYCKLELFTRLRADAMPAWGVSALAYGENADDAARADRPGAQAAREAGVLFPLSQVGATKRDVRELAAAFGLDCATKPAAPCLASRIPHGEPVTEDKLAQIDAAEDVVLAAGFSDCRVRHHGDIARLEVPAAELGRLGEDTVRERVLTGVRHAGFAHVCVDLAGLQSGVFTLTLLGANGTEVHP